MAHEERVPIPGSERTLVPGHVRVGRVGHDEGIDVTVYLAHRVAPSWVDEQSARPPGACRHLARDQWAQAHGAHPDDVNRVTEFAEANGLIVGRVDEARRQVELKGAAEAVARAFGAHLEGRYAADEDAPVYRARSGPLTVPAVFDGIITGVLGIDDRPQARPQIRFAAAGATAYTPPQVAAAYGFPTGDGAGQTIALIELGGGFREADLTAYFQELGLAVPSVTAVAVDGGENSPGVNRDADGEVMLDIEVAGSIAPGAAIVVYFAPNTDRGFIDAVSQAVHDTGHAPSVVSISWGGSEDSWTAQARTQMEQVLIDAGGLGVTVTVAAGDGGSSDGASDGRPHVDFPASAPHALACGGTTLELGSGGAITSETVWDTANDGATGGGVSDVFALPAYQSEAKVPDNATTGRPGRGVPDVAGDANPQTGYTIRVDGSTEAIGGTSAVAPLWAALIARLNQSLGAPLGFAHPHLYRLLGTTAFHDITAGSNGVYAAGPGWDACSGLGSPAGAALDQALRSTPT